MSEEKVERSLEELEKELEERENLLAELESEKKRLEEENRKLKNGINKVNKVMKRLKEETIKVGYVVLPLDDGKTVIVRDNEGYKKIPTLKDVDIGEYVLIAQYSIGSKDNVKFGEIVLDKFGVYVESIRAGIITDVLMEEKTYSILVKEVSGSGSLYKVGKKYFEKLLNKLNIADVSSLIGKEMYVTREGIIVKIAEPRSDFNVLDEKVYFSDVGGLYEIKKEVKKKILNVIKNRKLAKKLGIELPKALLFYGPPGTGKTLMAKAIANELGYKCYYINGTELVKGIIGASAETLRRLFIEARKNSPSVIIIDEMDAIAQKRDEGLDQERRSIVSQLLTELERIRPGEIIVIATTNRIDDVDPALRRPGRFDLEFSFPVPDERERNEILGIHLRNSKYDENIDLEKLTRKLYGYTGADIENLVKEAKYSALERIISRDNETTHYILLDDISRALKKVKPSIWKPYSVEKPQVSMGDVGGTKKVKEIVNERILSPIKDKRMEKLYKDFNLGLPRGILFYGPPGTGKTLMAKAIAGESNLNFIYVKGSEIYSKWVGESEKSIREIFATAERLKPCIIYVDDAESLFPKRGTKEGDPVVDKVVVQLLAEMDGLVNKEGIIVIFSTNRKDLLDEAILRAGRMDILVEFPLPDYEGRKEIFKIHLEKRRKYDKNIDLDYLSKVTEGFSGAEIEEICKRAAYRCIRRYHEEKDEKYKLITQEDLLFVINEYKKERDKKVDEDIGESFEFQEYLEGDEGRENKFQEDKPLYV